MDSPTDTEQLGGGYDLCASIKSTPKSKNSDDNEMMKVKINGHPEYVPPLPKVLFVEGLTLIDGLEGTSLGNIDQLELPAADHNPINTGSGTTHALHRWEEMASDELLKLASNVYDDPFDGKMSETPTPSGSPTPQPPSCLQPATFPTGTTTSTFNAMTYAIGATGEGSGGHVSTIAGEESQGSSSSGGNDDSKAMYEDDSTDSKNGDNDDDNPWGNTFDDIRTIFRKTADKTGYPVTTLHSKFNDLQAANTTPAAWRTYESYFSENKAKEQARHKDAHGHPVPNAKAQQCWRLFKMLPNYRKILAVHRELKLASTQQTLCDHALAHSATKELVKGCNTENQGKESEICSSSSEVVILDHKKPFNSKPATVEQEQNLCKVALFDLFAKAGHPLTGVGKGKRKVKSEQLPWSTMPGILMDEGIQLADYPWGVPIPSNATKASKNGIKCLPTAATRTLLEALRGEGDSTPRLQKAVAQASSSPAQTSVSPLPHPQAPPRKRVKSRKVVLSDEEDDYQEDQSDNSLSATPTKPRMTRSKGPSKRTTSMAFFPKPKIIATHGKTVAEVMAEQQELAAQIIKKASKTSSTNKASDFETINTGITKTAASIDTASSAPVSSIPTAASTIKAASYANTATGSTCETAPTNTSLGVVAETPQPTSSSRPKPRPYKRPLPPIVLLTTTLHGTTMPVQTTPTLAAASVTLAPTAGGSPSDNCFTSHTQLPSPAADSSLL
ncbi:hypothetical protein C0991_008893 [Blastosporella zonata]|nr:hypothetical protein C0991_008893 [Blastosporella zonata]